MDRIVEFFLLPFAVAVITYWLFKKHDEWSSRKQYSLLDVAIMNCLLEEVENGIKIMKNQQNSPLPTKSWSGVSTIQDEVLLRIIATAPKKNANGFKPQEIRIHTKNYFEMMSVNWDAAIKINQTQQLQGKYVEAAEGVKSMLEECRYLLENNAGAWFPK